MYYISELYVNGDEYMAFRGEGSAIGVAPFDLFTRVKLKDTQDVTYNEERTLDSLYLMYRNSGSLFSVLGFKVHNNEVDAYKVDSIYLELIKRFKVVSVQPVELKSCMKRVNWFNEDTFISSRGHVLQVMFDAFIAELSYLKVYDDCCHLYLKEKYSCFDIKVEALRGTVLGQLIKLKMLGVVL